MMKEDYVSFEIAKLLKEKGFDGFCNRYYQTDKEDVNGEYALFMFASDLKSFCTVTNSLLNKYADKNHEIISAPTIQMAIKWLREVHNLFIEIMVGDYDGRIWYDFDVINIGEKDIPTVPIDDIMELETYEEAAEAAIKYCLENLI